MGPFLFAGRKYDPDPGKPLEGRDQEVVGLANGQETEVTPGGKGWSGHFPGEPRLDHLKPRRPRFRGNGPTQRG